MKLKLKELNGSFNNLEALVVSSEVKLSTKGSEYLQLSITDGLCTVTAKKWNCSEGDKVFTKGSVISATGKVETWNGNKSIILDSIYPSVTEASEFYKHGPSVHDFIVAYFNSLDLGDETSDIVRLTRSILKRYNREFFTVPAAVKMHHDYREGLAQHTMEVVDIALKSYDSRIDLTNETLDRSLIVCGALLHDIGKCECYSFEDGVPCMTEVGKFKDHLVVGSQILNEEAVILSIDRTQDWFLMLDHIVLSHHGKLEYGSPVAPCFPEARLIHLADLMSAQMAMIDSAVSEIDGEWGTKRDFIFGSYLFAGNKQNDNGGIVK